MEDEDFVADSDEDEQEMLEALAVAEERLACQRLEEAAASGPLHVAALQEPEQQPNEQVQEQATVAAVTPEQPQKVQGQNDTRAEAIEKQESEEETDDEQDEGETEEQQGQEQQETDSVLDVGTLVEVESRTWPGINKQGGAGRVTRVYREKATDVESEEIFYDVRYVLGGFERHIEREYVHSSELLKKHSNRKKVGRDYYHDDFINEPHLRKQRETEERRERMIAHSEQAEGPRPHPRKRKRPHRSAHVDQLHNKSRPDAQDLSRSEDDARERRKVPKIGDEMFVLTERSRGSLEVSSRPRRDSEKPAYAAPSPLLKQFAVDQRRRHRIMDSSDEGDSAGEDARDNGSHRLVQPEQLQHTDIPRYNESLATGGTAEVSRGNSVEKHHRRKRKKYKSSRRRYVGGYEHNEEDADGTFIQPEGDPAELPEDVIRETGLRLATTSDGLMKQLQDIFAQQQKNIADFHQEQKLVDQKMKVLSGMPLTDLQDLHRKVFDLDKVFLTKTLVNAGEDAMNTISRKLEMSGKRPTAFATLDMLIGNWKEKLKECAQWVRNVTRAVKDAFAWREEQIPIEQVAQAEYSSDSSYSGHDYHTGYVPGERAEFDGTPDDVDFSFDYEPESASRTGNQKRQLDHASNVVARRLNVFKPVKQSHQKKRVITTTTLKDYFPRQGSFNGCISNLRLIGRHEKILRSDPRWNWVKIAMKKKKRVTGIQGRSTERSSVRFSSGYGSVHAVHEVRSTNSRRDEHISVQDQRMYFRNKRFHAQPMQHRSRESFLAPQIMRNASQTVYPADIPLTGITAEKRLRPAEHVNTAIHSSKFKHQSINWEVVFEVVADDPTALANVDKNAVISRQGQEKLLAFGHPICGPMALRHLFVDERCEFEDCENFGAVVKRRAAGIRQLMNDLRFQETSYMDLLAREGLGAVDEEGYANAHEWILLVSLEEAYHNAIASLAAQVLEVFEEVPPSTWPIYLKIVLEEIATLIRQLPDCNSLFSGCKAYFFFFEVASIDSATTPLLTAISRTYWYCLNVVVALRRMSDRLAGSHVTARQEIGDAFMRILPVNRVILTVVLFLFDLYIYLPSSHLLENAMVDSSPSSPLPALSLWMLVRGCCSSSAGVDHPDEESLSTKEKHFWALLQAIYRQRYIDELARCFVRSESCGGYLRDFAPKATDGGNTEESDEAFESQLLALEATWDLLAVLTRIYADVDGDEHQEAVCDAKWAVVKDLLQPGKPDFLPFTLSPSQSTELPSEYRQCADHYKQHVLRRVTTFSKLWRPSKEIVELIMRQLWDSDTLHHPDDSLELPNLLKQFISRSKEYGNSRLRLAGFAEENDDDGDLTTALCKIIWIQLLKLEKRVHRSRFRSSVLNMIPATDNKEAPTGLAHSKSTLQASQKKSGTDWNWEPKQRTLTSKQPAKQPGTTSQRSSMRSGKERMSTAVLLTFAVIGICLECGDEQQFPVDRPSKDVRYMEREVDFYCKEILRWTSGKPECEVLAAQALFTLGALLLEKNSTEFPIIFGGLNDRLESSMKKLQADPFASTPSKPLTGTSVNALKNRNLENCQRFQSAAMASLYQMRDLIRMMLDIPSSGVYVGSAYGAAVEKSLEHIFGAGMEACLNGVIQKCVMKIDLKIAIEIFQLVLPRAPDKPQKCFAFIPAPTCDFDFDDDIFAHIDQALLSGGQSSIAAQGWTIKECRPRAIQLIISNLRAVLQQLVLNYPSADARTLDELYSIDLLGMIISTCEVQFFWSHVTSTSVKSRNLAPRVLGAVLKYNPEKEWLCNVFLRESGADHELTTAWLLGTLDISALNTVPIVFKLDDVPFGIGKVIAPEATTHEQNFVRDSDYWAMLTDGIIYHFLRNKSDGFGAMDPHLLKILREVASTCKFPSSVRVNADGLHNVATLYDLHLDVFQSFCRSAGANWSSYTTSATNNFSSSNWREMNQFRTKMVNSQSGIFVSFLEAYKINFRRACSEIDQVNHDWHAFAELFLRQAGVNATGGRSYHERDDTIKSFDKRLTGLTTMFRFMYQCMDAFLFYCGEMAIGESNLFFDAMELLFRQVNDAEYPHAIKRLEEQRRSAPRSGARNVNDELRRDFCAAAMRFVDSVQLFFARQKYPSLLHWFAQTSEIYQTFKSGWPSSPLRTLLVNILDPDGPLGIFSYYPDVTKDSGLDIDVNTVRREAFYLSCGFFNCRCSRSYEHSRAYPGPVSCERLQQLRKFVLDDFMRETFSFVVQEEEDVSSLLEAMVPLCQFVRAVLNHANLNAKATQVNELSAENGEDNLALQDFQLSELHPCLEWMVECLIKLVPGEEAVNSTICCVLLTELCGIMCEVIAFNDHRPMLELIDLVELVLSYLQTVCMALSKQTTTMIGTLFAASLDLSPSVKLSAHRFSPSAFRDIVVGERFSQVSGRQIDTYGISLARTATNLLTAIGRVAQQCETSSDEHLRGFATVSL